MMPPSPTPASELAPRRPTNSVETSVIALYESIEIVIGHACLVSSASGRSIQGSGA